MEKKKEMKEKRRTNLDDQIYFLTYAHPMYKDQLSEIIFKKKGSPVLSKKLKKLEQKNWITILNYKETIKQYPNIISESEKQKIGKRRYRRQYILANPEVLIEKISDRLLRNKTELTKEDKKELRQYIVSEEFVLNLKINRKVNYIMDGGDVYDVFHSMINFILIDCFHKIIIQNIVEADNLFPIPDLHKSNSHNFTLSHDLMLKLGKLDSTTFSKMVQVFIDIKKLSIKCMCIPEMAEFKRFIDVD